MQSSMVHIKATFVSFPVLRHGYPICLTSLPGHKLTNALLLAGVDAYDRHEPRLRFSGTVTGPLADLSFAALSVARYQGCRSSTSAELRSCLAFDLYRQGLVADASSKYGSCEPAMLAHP